LLNISTLLVYYSLQFSASKLDTEWLIPKHQFVLEGQSFEITRIIHEVGEWLRDGEVLGFKGKKLTVNNSKSKNSGVYSFRTSEKMQEYHAKVTVLCEYVSSIFNTNID